MKQIYTQKKASQIKALAYFMLLCSPRAEQRVALPAGMSVVILLEENIRRPALCIIDIDINTSAIRTSN
ncbi:hypothetical protein VTN02DRAFT_6729 [Thermoascus thermophilus]